MSKSVLVIDTPENCRLCDFLSGSHHLKFCCANRRYIEDISKRSCWCPLKPLPEKMTGAAQTDHWNSIKAGWNACIDKITGGE